MKMTKTFTLLATLALGLSVAAGTSTVKAATTNTPTTAEATLTTKDDPDNPDDGKIVLKSVPAINFGTKELDGSAIKFEQADTIDAPIKVLNPGIVAGWTVSVFRSKFMNGNVELKGAVLNFGDGVIADNNNSADATNLPAGGAITVDDEAAIVLDASKVRLDGTYPGVGEITRTLAKTDTTLDVPANNTAGVYKADLTWTLTDSAE
ncbi:WxL domain-containing protein [Lapidilactobacillus gannanensis]|uniref:WxL domain-containing protein n=1 Tax=Lapidilactobacillus gannanensis TaxID=2486002 RepID=A0ABW4BLF6_9LACO|nr:WxL domain-containing protein [Lapidilactobacillus gannanensis]